MKSRFAMNGICAAALLLLAGCDEHSYLNVWIVSGPDHVAPGDAATFVVTSKATNWSPTFQYAMNWGDTTTVTPKGHVSGDTDRMTHVWRYPGRYQVWATAQLLQHQEYGYLIHGSTPRTVVVSTDSDPVIDSAQFYHKWRPTELVVFARHPTGESLRLAVAWGDGKADTTGLQSSPCQFRTTHDYADYGDRAVVFRALSQSGAVSAPETLSVFVTTTGQVVSFWDGAYAGSPVVVGEVIYLVGPTGFCGLRDGATQYVYPGSFVGHPSFSGQAEHIYIGSEEGQLYAFTRTLQPAWAYPESAAGWRWGSVAVKGSALYAPCSNDSVYCLADNGATVTREAAFGAPGVDAVAMDAAGSIYVDSDSGCVFKLTSGLEPVWRASLHGAGRVFAPVLGADGTVYCSSDSDRLFALEPADGSVKWSAMLGGVCYHPVVGPDGIYAGAVAGMFHKLDLNSGASVWVRRVGNHRLAAAPVVTVDGYVYVQSDGDGRLYCVRQSSGDSVWVCNTAKYNPQPRGRAASLTDGTSCPTVDSLGRVYVVGNGMLSKLNTWTPLDASSPWPKWQHDLYNSGYAGGGR